jgi:hypothetical protein
VSGFLLLGLVSWLLKEPAVARYSLATATLLALLVVILAVAASES